MPLKIQSPGELLAGQQQAITQAAIDLTVGVVNGKPPTMKSAMVTAALEAYGKALTGLIEEAIRNVKAGYEMIEGEKWEALDAEAYDAGLEAAVSAELDDIAPVVGAPFASVIVAASLLTEPHSVAKSLADEICKSKKPAGPHMGKFLSAIGILDGDIKAAEAEAETQRRLYAQQQPVDTTGVGYNTSILADPPAPPPPPVTYIPPSTPLPPAAFAAPPPPPSTLTVPLTLPPGPSVSSVPPKPPAAEPDAAAIKRAWKLWGVGGNADLDAFAKKLGMSVSTLRNRFTGRAEGKVTAAQAQVMVADIDKTISELTEARAIFAAVRG